MYLNIAVRLRDLDTHGNINRDIYAKTCYLIMLGIKQSRDHVTNQSLYQLTGQVALQETIRMSLYSHADRRTRQPICHL